jgi:myosin heavy subunit
MVVRDNTDGAAQHVVAEAAQAVAALGKVELAMYVARHDSIMQMESRLQKQRDELQLERQEMLLELERSEQEMELCRSELRARQEEIDSLRNEAAVRLQQDTAFFKEQKAEIERLKTAAQEHQERQPQRQQHGVAAVGDESLSALANSASTQELHLAAISPQEHVQLPLVPHASTVPVPSPSVRPAAVVSEEQLTGLQARLLAMHAAELLQDEELFHLEDVCADFIAIRSALAGGVVTQDVVQWGGSEGPGALVSTLVGLSEGMANDGSFARQCRRRLRSTASRQAGFRTDA